MSRAGFDTLETLMIASTEDLITCGLSEYKIAVLQLRLEERRRGSMTLREAASSVMGPLPYAPSSLSICRKKSSPFLKKPAAVVQWIDFVPQVILYSESLGETEAIFSPFTPRGRRPFNETDVIDFMSPTFCFVHQLGGRDNVPSINYWVDHREAREMGFTMATQADKLWILEPCTIDGKARVIAAVLATERKSCPSLPGFGLIEAYESDLCQDLVGVNQSKTCEHVHRLFGHMEAEQVKYGMICTDGMFWFAQIEAGSVGTLRLSEGIATDQASPLTAVQAILYSGSLAAVSALMGEATESQDQLLQDPSQSHGALFPATSKSLTSFPLDPRPILDPISIWLGTMIGYGSTGTVHQGWIKRGDQVQDAVIKCANGTHADASRGYEGAAEARLINEAVMYERLVHLQGSIIPRLIDQGTLFVECDGREIPFIAMELHKNASSLRHLPKDFTPPSPAEKETILSGLRQIHAAGIAHSSVRLRNVIVLDVEDKSEERQFRWIDFGGSFDIYEEGTYEEHEENKCKWMYNK